MERRRAGLMAGQYRKATQEPNEFIKFAIKSDSEPSTWYILLTGFSGDDDEYSYTTIDSNGNTVTKYGEYLCRMEAPNDFPYKPPHFYMLTPNGVYGINSKVCISIGEFHAEQYRAALGMSGFANQLVSGLIGWKSLGHGIQITDTTVQHKKDLAEISKCYNDEHHSEILMRINESFEAYSSKWDMSKVSQYMKDKLGLGGNSSE